MGIGSRYWVLGGGIGLGGAEEGVMRGRLETACLR